MTTPRHAASLLSVLALTATMTGHAMAQSADDLKYDEKTPADVLVYGMGYSGARYSPLTQINKENVAKLVPVWGYSMSDNRGSEGFTVIKDGVVYATTHSATVAVDALTGKQIWKVVHEYPPEALRVVCCGIVNRGPAMYEGKIIRALMDNRIIALDVKTGKEVWQAKSPDPATTENGYAMTGAPLIVDGVVIVGVAGAEYSHRGFVEGYDAQTGKHLWRSYNIPGKGEKGSETWKGETNLVGGGSSWVTGTYDPELDLVYWGTGNPSPWNPRTREGDALWTNSIIAFRPKTGERVWAFQTTPADPFDYDGIHTPVRATLTVDGQPRKVVMQANRGGFLYVLDAKDGKLIAANAYGKVNWADGIDLKTGRPKWTQVYHDAVAGKKVTVWPSVSGVSNWYGFSYNPDTGLAYINTLHVGMTYEAPDPQAMAPGKPSGPGSVKRTTVTDDPNIRGYLKAVDPLTGKSKWEVPYKSPNWSSTMSTASRLVFTGVMTGEFQALDADTGKVLWSFQTPSGILGQPVTWERNGKQYVTVMSGIGGVYAQRAGDPNLENVPAGDSIWTFALFDK
jgi:alcohol dehydrogenase (cytochrome c)